MYNKYAHVRGVGQIPTANILQCYLVRVKIPQLIFYNVIWCGSKSHETEQNIQVYAIGEFLNDFHRQLKLISSNLLL